MDLNAIPQMQRMRPLSLAQLIADRDALSRRYLAACADYADAVSHQHPDRRRLGERMRDLERRLQVASTLVDTCLPREA